jgi:lipase/acylhydrolase, GDSL family
MKVCFLGCGVIGSLYAALFAKARISVELYARGERKKVLEDRGLEIEIGGRVVQFNLPLVADLKHNYDFLFVAVKNEQIEDALQELKESPCRNIVTMVNTAEGYEKWEEIVGKGRLIPAFPGAGGEIQGGVVKASLTPRFIQKTTFGEIYGEKTRRLERLEKLFKKAKIPYELCRFMGDWQLCHLALIVPLGDAIREGRGNHQDAASNRLLMKKTIHRMKRNLCLLHKQGIEITPNKLKGLFYFPESISCFLLKELLRSKLGENYIYPHAHHAQKEMARLHNSFYNRLRKGEK